MLTRQRENHNAYHRVWFRPRILRNVKNVDFSTKIWDFPTSMPIYITATALGKLGHPEGEVALTKAAGKHDVIQMVSRLADVADHVPWRGRDGGAVYRGSRQLSYQWPGSRWPMKATERCRRPSQDSPLRRMHN